MGEKKTEVMRNISSFSAEKKIDVLIDKFKEMRTGTKRIKLTKNFNYALGLQFIERLQSSP